MGLRKTSRPIFVRVVSVNKAARITPVLDRIDTMVLNSAEAKFVSGIEVHDEASARDCAEHLLRSGVRNVFLFVDDSDMLYCCEHESFFLVFAGKGGGTSIYQWWCVGGVECAGVGAS